MNVWYGLFIFGFLSSALGKSIYPKDDKKPFTLEEAALDKFKQKRLTSVWISDNELEYRDLESGDIKILNAATLKSSVFLPNSVIESYKGVSYNVSADRKYVLIKYDPKGTFNKAIGHYGAWNGLMAFQLLYMEKAVSRYEQSYGTNCARISRSYFNISEGQDVQAVKWSPVGNALAYVKDNNLYYVPAITPAMNPVKLTTDGIPGVVYNGATDWVYEEEVLCTDTAFSFSPKAKYLTYTKFIDHNVGVVRYLEYGKPGDYGTLYPKEVRLRFPKVGTENPAYQVWLVDLKNVKNQRLLYNSSKAEPSKEVFYGQTWINDDLNVLVFSNRVQNESQVIVYELLKNTTKKSYENKNPRGWANTEIPRFNSNGAQMLKISAEPFNKDEYDHLKIFSKNKTYALTSGAFEVVEFLDWDQKNKVIYYKATEVDSPSTIQVYRISEGENSKPYCLTCRIKSPEGRGCKHAHAVFSKEFSYVLIQCNGPDPRMIYLFKNENPMKDPLMVLDNSAKLRATLSKKLMPEIMNLTAPIPGPFKAEVRLYLPPNMDRSGKTKYPMLLYVYGGTNSKQIYDNFQIDVEMYWTTNQSVIYAVVDARNTNNKGKNMLYAGYRRIGTLEMEDQITVTKYLQKTLPFIDTKRTGVWGWSFGGFSTFRILQLDDENVFKCGVAVAPAVDWVLYDTMWSERYMGSFRENRQNYLKASLFTDVKKLKNKRFYLITGNADDNVHYQQPMLLTRALELNDIMFESLSYPEEAHSLLGVRPHLFHSMDKFWKSCFDLK